MCIRDSTYSGVFADELQQIKDQSDARIAESNQIRVPEKKEIPLNLREFMGIDEDDQDEFQVDSMRIL